MAVAPALVIVADLTACGSEAAWHEHLARWATVNRPRVALHVRANTLTGAKRTAALARARGVSSGSATLHGRTHEAQALGFERVHWPEARLQEPSETSVLPASASVHSVQAASRAAGLGALWVLFGPVFAPNSKPGVGVGLAALAEVVRASQVPVVAIGGLDRPSRAAACREVGAAGVAIITAAMTAQTSFVLSQFLDQQGVPS